MFRVDLPHRVRHRAASPVLLGKTMTCDHTASPILAKQLSRSLRTAALSLEQYMPRSTPEWRTSLCAALTFVFWCGAAAAGDVVFGQIASISNPASTSNATGLMAGAKACFESINAHGGIHGNKLRLDTRDDSLNGPKMVAMTAEMINDPSIVGLLSFLNTAGLTELTKKNAFGIGKIALIAPLQGDKAVVEAENVFPLRSGYGDELEALLKEAKTWGKDTISIVNMN